MTASPCEGSACRGSDGGELPVYRLHAGGRAQGVCVSPPPRGAGGGPLPWALPAVNGHPRMSGREAPAGLALLWERPFRRRQCRRGGPRHVLVIAAWPPVQERRRNHCSVPNTLEKRASAPEPSHQSPLTTTTGDLCASSSPLLPRQPTSPPTSLHFARLAPASSRPWRLVSLPFVLHSVPLRALPTVLGGVALAAPPPPAASSSAVRSPGPQATPAPAAVGSAR